MSQQSLFASPAVSPAADHACMICGSASQPYFSKRYATLPPGAPFPSLEVDYARCSECGFVASTTHKALSPEHWVALNAAFHHSVEAGNEGINQPPYADQALAMLMLARNGVLDLDDALDYAAGYGTLSKFASKYFGAKIRIFDRYVTGGDDTLEYVEEAALGKYGLVINSAMFEHVLERKDLDNVDALVADDGVLMMHSVVCERVPADPNWFYLDPVVHTAFHTNASMAVLMAQWGYGASVYAPQAKSWFLFKQDNPKLGELESVIERINAELQCRYFIYKRGFVDYWKGF
ncbi:class I SAM-dependent methyltransferase [Cupriavidus respiraculi]|uniref:methyltransferase domain-containing protein n=1 Tax=Cupriavidus respiraculi TaxID=195930 RepID=UPI001F21BF8E|nr:methyltransferase domain-containing protein [Cupriavidus respiraculi]